MKAATPTATTSLQGDDSKLDATTTPSYSSTDDNHHRRHHRHACHEDIDSNDGDDDDNNNNEKNDLLMDLSKVIRSKRTRSRSHGDMSVMTTGTVGVVDSNGTAAIGSVVPTNHSGMARERFEKHGGGCMCCTYCCCCCSATDDDRLIGPYEYAVIISVIIYWLFVSLIPIYNKYFFQKTKYPYPVATAGIQLCVVSLLLAIVNIIQHYVFYRIPKWHRRRQRTLQKRKHRKVMWSQHSSSSSCNSDKNTNSRVKYDDTTTNNNNKSNNPKQLPPASSSSLRVPSSNIRRSFILGPYFFWKMKWCFPIGFLFGVKYGVTNMGLNLINAPTHLLLQSTDLVWTVLGAWWINGELVDWTELLCLGGCVVGSIVLGFQVLDDTTIKAPLFAIVINLISPMLLGLCIATLRLACVELMRPDNRVGGTVSSVELTSIKLMMSSSVALILACFLEGGGNEEGKDSWWVAFAELPTGIKLGVCGGAVLIAVFQANCTFLTYLTNAVAVGLVGQVKIIPQWTMAIIFSTKVTNFTIKPTAILGAFLICGSAAIFAFDNWRRWKEEESGEESAGDGTVMLVENAGEGDQLLSPSTSDETSDDAAIDSRNALAQKGATHRHTSSDRHLPLLLYTDADDWGTASIRSSFYPLDDDTAKERNRQRSI